MLIRNATLDGRRVDLRLDGEHIAEIGTGLRGEELLDAAGATVLPGLVDHHLHLHAMAAAADRSVDLTGLDRDQIAGVLKRAPGDMHGWVRAVGLGEDLDGATITALHKQRPVRVQHDSGAFWVVNHRGAEKLGLATADHPGIERTAKGRPTGRLWRADDWLRSKLPWQRIPDLADIGQELAMFGVTSVTDATPDIDSFDASALPQRVTLLGVGLETTPPPGVAVGPHKIVLADSGLPEFDDLVARIRAAHGTGRGVAVHCVTREALALLLAAFSETGTVDGDRLEHAAIVPREAIPMLAARGLRVVTQPGFIRLRGHRYWRDVPAEDLPDLYRCASLLAGGVRVALSSDAPYGPMNPWWIIEAAATRSNHRDPRVLGPIERLGPDQALAAYLAPPDDPGGPPRRIAPGAPADLVLRSPDGDVQATVIAGRQVL